MTLIPGVIIAACFGVLIAGAYITARDVIRQTRDYINQEDNDQ